MAVSLDRFLPPEAGPHRRLVDECSWCEGPIHAGDELYDFDDMRFCSYDCLLDWVRERTIVTTA